MNERPRLLDLFCGAGGAAVGYHRAGFEVVGVDIKPQPHYPFEFHQADAMTYPLEGFDVIHASPPCQAFTKYKNAGNRRDLPERYPDLVAATRERLVENGLPFVIENVVGAPLFTVFVLCGSAFGLDIQRHRLFETNVLLLAPGCDHTVWPANRFPGGRSRERGGARVKVRNTVEVGRWNIPLHTQEKAMGIDWMTLEELSEAIPPAYTEYIGKQLLRHLAATYGQPLKEHRLLAQIATSQIGDFEEGA